MTNLAVAASQIRHTSPERVVVVNARYKFLLHVRNTSFDVAALEASYPHE
jgi:hypothetical protein